MVACQRFVLVLLIGRYDDDPPGIVVDLRGVLQILVRVNAIFFFKDGFQVEILEDLSAEMLLKFSVKHQSDVIYPLEVFEKASDGPPCEP